MKTALTLLIACIAACNGHSSSNDPPGPSDPDPVSNCQTTLQGLTLNDSLKLTDLDNTTVFIKNNAQQLQRIAPEEAVTVWDCMEKGN